MTRPTHELRFSSTADSGFFWQTGLFYYKDEVDGKGGLHLPFGQQADPTGFGIYLNTFYRPDFESESKAAFGQIEVPFADTFTAVLGARYTQDDKSGTFYSFAGPPAFGTGRSGVQLRPIEEANVVNPAESDHDETTWTVGVNWQPGGDSLHYAKISKGYKAGGFDAVGTYDPETVIAYEIGSKNQFGNSLFNIAAFYYDYEDLQASVLLDTTVGGQIFNAGKAEIYGVEADYEVNLTDNDTLKLTANYLTPSTRSSRPSRKRFSVSAVAMPTRYRATRAATPYPTRPSGYSRSVMTTSGTWGTARSPAAFSADTRTNTTTPSSITRTASRTRTPRPMSASSG